MAIFPHLSADAVLQICEVTSEYRKPPRHDKAETVRQENDKSVPGLVHFLSGSVISRESASINAHGTFLSKQQSLSHAPFISGFFADFAATVVQLIQIIFIVVIPATFW